MKSTAVVLVPFSNCASIASGSRMRTLPTIPGGAGAVRGAETGLGPPQATAAASSATVMSPLPQLAPSLEGSGAAGSRSFCVGAIRSTPTLYQGIDER